MEFAHSTNVPLVFLCFLLRFLFYFYIILFFESFSSHIHPIVSHWSLIDSKSPQVTRILHSILADLNNAIVWMVFTRPPFSTPPCLCTKPLVTVTRAPITISINTFQFPSKVKVSILLFAFFQFYSAVPRNSKVHNLASSLFCFCLFYSLVVCLR